MLRVSCPCGKTLGVTDDFAGKQVRCPACLSVLNVPGPAAAAAPPPPAANAPALPRRRRSPFAVLALLFGGATVALLALAGVAVAVLLWLKPWAAKTDPSPGSKDNPVAVRLHVPPKVGDRREVNLTFESELHEESKSDAGKQSRQISDKVQLTAVLRTLAVDKEGRETRREFTVKKFTHTPSSGQEKSILPEGAVFLVDGFGGKAAVRAATAGGTPQGLQRAFGMLQGATFEDADLTADGILGTSQKQSVGGSWPVNKQELARWLKHYLELTIEPDAVSGTGKLAAATKEGEAYALDFEASATATLDAALAKVAQGGAKGSGKAQLSWSGRYPADYGTGPVRSAVKLDASVRFTGGDAAQRDLTFKFHWLQTVSYLPAAKGPESPNPGRAGVLLSAAKVKRSALGNDAEMSVHYSLPRDEAPGKKWYCKIEFKGPAPPNDWADGGSRDSLQAEGEWLAPLKLDASPPAGTAFVLYFSDEPLTTPDARKLASQVQGVVE
jgi:hypothetical protein